MRALVVSNMWPSDPRPAFGSFVADQVRALRRLAEAEIEVHHFGPGGYRRAAAELRRRWRGARFDVVHAHFGLTLWPAAVVPATVHAVTLHGTDLVAPRSRAATLAGLRLVDLPAVVSAPLAARVPGWSVRRPPAVLPCGVALDRFVPMERRQARTKLGISATERLLLFPADPARSEKRVDRARAVAQAANARLVTLGAEAPDRMPLWMNAADAVLVPSERESFGLAMIEALACGVPVLSTPVGIASEALAGIDGTVCAAFDVAVWADAVARIAGTTLAATARERAAQWSADAMADRVLAAWRECLGR